MNFHIYYKKLAMKKFSSILLIILCCNVQFAQDTILPPAVETIQEDLVTNSTTIHPFETTPKELREPTINHERSLAPKFKDQYRGEKFDYDRIVEQEPSDFHMPEFNLPQGLLKVLMYVILGFIVLLIVYHVFKNAGGFSFGKEKHIIKYQTGEESEMEDSENINNNDFGVLIQRAKEKEDYRKAVRYYYLWVLQKLADRNLILWNKDKTDYEYYLELATNPIREDFSANTYIYDYTWYGNFNLSNAQFQQAERLFQRTLNQLN